MKNYEELDALIDACLDGRLSEEEADALSKRIEASGEARERYWQLASVHGMLEPTIQNASLNLKKVGPPRLTLLLVSMAFGLCLGVLQALVRDNPSDQPMPDFGQGSSQNQYGQPEESEESERAVQEAGNETKGEREYVASLPR